MLRGGGKRVGRPLAARAGHRVGRWSRGLLACAALLAGSGAGLGCVPQESKTALGYAADAKRAYDDAMVEFDDKNWLEAQALFREVKRRYGYSRYAKLSELRLADIDFAQDKLAEAVRQYRQFVHDHRADQAEVVYARSRIAEAEYKQINESLLLPSADERDQAVVMDAYREVKSFIADYPDAKESEHIRTLLADVTARLVRHELYVARFYLNRSNYVAAVGRILYALHNFGGAEAAPQDLEPAHEADAHELEVRGGRDATASRPRAPAAKPQLARVPGHTGSGLEPEALVLLGETYLKMKQLPEAREAFEAVTRDYPESPLVVQARNYLVFMGTPAAPRAGLPPRAPGTPAAPAGSGG